MFRASHITSSFGGIAFGSLVGVDDRTAMFSTGGGQALLMLVFFAEGLLLVTGIPQWREARERREQRAACHEIHRADDWQRFRDDLRLFYLPVWGRMLTFVICTIITTIVIKKL